MEDDARHNDGKSVTVDVEWHESTVTPAMRETGVEQPLHREVTCVVKEEVRLPKERIGQGLERPRRFASILAHQEAGNR